MKEIKTIMKHQTTAQQREPSFLSYQPIEPKTELLLSRLSGVKNTGRDKWLAICPAHDDRSPSLAIKQADERILICCFAGCGYLDVLAAIGLDASSLFPDRLTNPYEKRKPAPRHGKAELFDLVVHEAGILALGWNDLLTHGTMPDVDKQRMQRAYRTVMDLICEVRR
jgi:hypothetical protein